ncbi:Rhodanese-related sulfurtransferase [secondary endosymbiont of Heteropsylla cubana]|uniref:Rhodanese-related sulfurtransferase n=1 Tax=secondary endosymbiont of Heteropsylla cubana TaxID=134287 RepID=J3YSV8_9ENTR|nr:rhodanese-like domain-containing protein [secondary endosymbiont of Heteropsylla cubana]AFP85403.1 Rhodanese-related sulfurtransferase [secondary endosymbiont of Heteropsylla cubana]
MQKFIQFFIKHFILSLSWIFIFCTLIFVVFQNYFSKLKKITRIEAIQLINKEDAVIIDLRDYYDYQKGHIVNSLNLSQLDLKCQNLQTLGKEKHKPIIVVCNTGNESYSSAKTLITAGFNRVYVLTEGIYGWKKENLPLVSSKST